MIRTEGSCRDIIRFIGHTNENDTADNNFAIDSLPYVDVVHEDYEHYALALVEEEMKKNSPTLQLPIPPIHHRSSIMKNECERFSARKKSEKTILDEKNTAIILSIDDMVNEQKINYEIERVRLMNLEIYRDSKSQISKSWRDYNSMLDSDLAIYKQVDSKHKQTIEQVNYTRQQNQIKAGDTLSRLNTKYSELLNTKYQLQHTIKNMEEGN